MPTLRRRQQQPQPVSPQVQVPPEFPPVPQEVLDRFPEAEKWQKKLADFWSQTTQALQEAQSQAARQANSQVVFSVDRFLIYAKGGTPQPMFALDSTGVKLGDVLVVNTPGRKVYIGEGNYSDAETPFYIDTDGFFSLGDQLTWDPDTAILTVTGVIIITGGTIGGFDIGSDYIRDAANSFGLSSTVTGGDDVRFWAGDTFANRATAPFRVTEAGNITANTATIIGTISGRSTATVAAAIDSAGDLVTDVVNGRLDTDTKRMLSDFTFGTTDYSGALKSGTITWNTTTGAITGGSGVLVYRGGIIGAAAGVATFTLDAATGSATFSGTVTATAGAIGGFNIGADYIRDAANSMGLASTVTGGDDVRFWAGNTFANRATAPFRVTEAGVLVATSATISGTITATTGTIGGFDVGADYIRDTANSFGLASTVTGGDDVRFWAGATFANRATAPLRFTEGGTGVIAGFGIATDRISAGTGGGYIAIYDGTGPTGIQLGETSGANVTLLSSSLTLFSAASTQAASMNGTGFNASVSNGAAYYSDGIQVVGAQQAAIADAALSGVYASDFTDIEDGINDILAALRAHGLIDT